jgi:hypothetical protein
MPRTEENDVPDIRDTLGQLDRRLAEIRDQIAGLADLPEPTPPPPPPDHRSIPLPTPVGFGDATGLEEPPESAEGRAYPDSAAVRSATLDRDRAQALATGVDQLGSQIEQLLSVRERLLADARQLLSSYRREIDELELQEAPDVRSALEALLDPEAPASGPAPALDGLPSRPAFFEGLVSVTVGPATRLQTIQVLENALARVPRVDQVYIRRWHAGQLWLELTVSGGVELIGELNRVLPFPFAVESASAQEIVIRLEGER